TPFNGKTPLHTAARTGQAAVAQVLLGAGADPNAESNVLRYTPLHLAAREGHVSVIEVLLTHGAKVDGTGWFLTPLDEAAQAGHLPVVKLLVSKGARINSQGGLGTAPLVWAVRYGHKAIVEYLLAQ